jgi:oligopeptide transport system ATP-binding protein
MYAGSIVEYGSVRDIFYKPMHEYTKGLLNSLPTLSDKSRKRLIPIPGAPVDMLDIPEGCPFAPRCGSCMKICLKQLPPVIYSDEGHYAACWLENKRIQLGEKEETLG